MAWCIKCGGTINEEGISYGEEIVFCECAKKQGGGGV